MQRHKDGMHRPIRRVVAFIQHCAPRVEQTSRNLGIGDLVTQIVSHSAIRINALKVWPGFTRKEERCDMKVLIVRRCEVAAPGLRLRKRGSLQRSQILQRSTQKRMRCRNPVAHCSTPPGKTAVLISREPPSRSIIRAKTPGSSSSPARPVMYSAHLNRPLVTRSNAVRHAAGV